MPGPGRLAPLALGQLAAWQQIAATWPLRIGDGHLRCAPCLGPVLAVFDANSTPYVLTPQQVTDATVLHLRNHHEDLDPDR